MQLPQWSQVMYQIMASEYIVSSIFFISGVLVLNFWLFNLLIAVITNSFSAIRSGTKRSAFGAAPYVCNLMRLETRSYLMYRLGRVADEPEDGWSAMTGDHVGQSRLKVWWSYTRWFWVILAFTSLVVQATASADMSVEHQSIIDITERIITFAFDIEILVRIAVELPAWRRFFQRATNLLDLILAIGSSVIQIPAIRNSSVYRWLTVFQLARFYRVILVIPRMKPLMVCLVPRLLLFVNQLMLC